MPLFADTYHSKYCTPGKCSVDHHASLAGAYLNACVLFATLFKKSPIGAAHPDGQVINGMPLPHGSWPPEAPALTAADALSLQRIAHQVVLGHDTKFSRHNLWKRPSDGCIDDPFGTIAADSTVAGCAEAVHKANDGCDTYDQVHEGYLRDFCPQTCGACGGH
jgi:hypothetical protein|eukprot:COSAG01_NODE_997_length_12228_cov_10.713991_6_plen_163_part_00